MEKKEKPNVFALANAIAKKNHLTKAEHEKLLLKLKKEYGWHE